MKLIVKENLMLRPYQVIYILPLQYVDYILERRKQGKVEGKEVLHRGGGRCYGEGMGGAMEREEVL